MKCIYNQDEFCTNDQCPMCGDYCPVPDTEGICKYEERKEVYYTLSPKGCLAAALMYHVHLDEDVVDRIWNDYYELMLKFGYIKEVE